MSNSYIVNAAPMVIDYGTQDLSTRQLPREAEAIPQHLPKFFIFSEKGPATPQLVRGSELGRVYGQKTFDYNEKYANHSTVFVNAVVAEDNAVMIQRLIPDDAGVEANLTFWLDVLETTLDVYQTDPFDGSIVVDKATGEPIVEAEQVTGYSVKWVVTHSATETELREFGKRRPIPGTQTDMNGNQSTRYPIMELVAGYKGEYGNLCGIRLWPLTRGKADSVITKNLDSNKAYPLGVSLIRRPDARSSADIVPTINAERSIVVTFKPGTLDPVSSRQNFIGDSLLQSYQNLTDLRYPPVLGDFGKFAIYNDYVADLLAKFHAAELPYLQTYHEIGSLPEDMYMFNMFTGQAPNGSDYRSFKIADDATSMEVLSEYNNFHAACGADGTMNDTVHAELTSRFLRRYGDIDDNMQDLAVNVESIIYDTGFPEQTKKDMAYFISHRKDTFVVLSTYDPNEPIPDQDAERAIAVGLRTRLQNYPESDYFGTPTMRGMIVGCSGIVRNSLYRKRLPLTLEVAIKAARYMGAADGRWKNGKHFDGAPGSILEVMTDISIPWVPTSARNRNWDAGLNWVQAYDRRSFHFPALKTVYTDDTSVLNSFATAMAICQLNKVAHACWREFTGVSNLTPAQLVQRVNDFVDSKTISRFDSRFVIKPEATLTEMDRLRGFSWTLPIKIYANNMRTVMTTYVQAYRMEDLDA